MSDSSGLAITGGPGSFAARLEDLEMFAGVMTLLGEELGAAAVSVTRIETDPDLLAAALICPVEAGRVGVKLAQLTHGPFGLVMLSALATATGIGLRASAAAYRAADQAAGEAFDTAAREAGAWLGRGFTLIGGALVTSPLGLLLVSMWGDDALVHLATDARDHPWLLDAAMILGPGAAEGAVSVVGGPVWTRWLFGGVEPAWSFDSRLDTLVAVGQLLGLFREDGEFVTAPIAGAEGAVEAPSSLADLMAEQVTLGNGSHDGQVTVIEVEQPDGSSAWIVQIPGTQSSSPVRGDSPVDGTSDVLLLAGQGSSLETAVMSAMEQAGVGGTDDVMLAGHSLGGIAAAALAGSPRLRERFTVTAVVSAGAPIARIPVPAEVGVLALEHRQDVIPKAEGRANPAGTRYVTVVADAPPHTGSPEAGPVARAHAASGYATTAGVVDRSRDPALADVRARHEKFFTGRGHGRRYQISPAPASPPLDVPPG